MQNRLDKTIETYRKNFDKYVKRTPAETCGEFKDWLDYFLSQIPKDGLILEIGSAAGRDARYFVSQGYKVLCTDVIPQALQKLSDEGFETEEFDFRNKPRPEWVGKFDGVFANAVFLHAPLETFENALKNIITVLKKDGAVAFSLKNGEGEEVSYEKTDAPRYFRYHNEQELKKILSKLPFEIIFFDYAENNKWIHVVMKVRNESNTYKV